MKGLVRFRKSDEGATAIEYAIVASLISVAIIAALFVLNQESSSVFDYISNKVVPALSGS